ncbi:hypothetical protein ABPG74_010548 [Tetrahymena malaccensis]
MSNTDDQETAIIKAFNASIEFILDKDKKTKHRFQQLVDIYKQIREEGDQQSTNKDEQADSQNQQNQHSSNQPVSHSQLNQSANNSSGVFGVNGISMMKLQHRMIKNTKLNHIWHQSLNQNYRVVYELIQDHLNKINPGFFQKLINQNNQCRDILQTLKLLYFFFDSLENVNIQELLKGVFRLQIIQTIYCCLDYQNKEEARILGFILLFKIISSYDFNQLFRLQELSVLTLFNYIIDFQSFSKPFSQSSIKDVCVFNSPSNAMPVWTNYIKDLNHEKSEKQYLDEIWKYMQLDVKNVRKWLLIFSQTWFQLCFDKSYLKWSEEYFKRQDTVTKQYQMIYGLATDQICLDQHTKINLTSSFLKQINFFFVILSTNKKEKQKERRSTAVIADLRHKLLSEKEYMHYIDLLHSYFDKEEYYKIANDIISTFSDQMSNFGDLFPVHYENDNIVLISSILMKIEESIIHEMTIRQNQLKKKQYFQRENNQEIHYQNYNKITPKRAEIYISCLQKLNHDQIRSTPYFKTFCTKVIKIGEDLLNEWMKNKDQDQEQNSKVLIDLFFLLMSYQERIFLAQLEKSFRKEDSHKLLDENNLNSEDIILLREKMHQMSIELLNRYNVLKNLSDYVKNITFKFIDTLYSQENLDIFQGEVVYLGNLLKKENQPYQLENMLQMILDVIKIRQKLQKEQRQNESVNSQINLHTMVVKERNLSQSQKSSASIESENNSNPQQKINYSNLEPQIKEKQDQKILQGVLKNYLNMGKLLNMEDVILLDEYIGNYSEAIPENKQEGTNLRDNNQQSSYLTKKGDNSNQQNLRKSDFSEVEQSEQNSNSSFVCVNASNENSETLFAQKKYIQFGEQNNNVLQQEGNNSDSNEGSDFFRLGSQFLTKQEIDRNISRFIHSKKSEVEESNDILEGALSCSKEESLNSSPKKNKSQNSKEKGCTSKTNDLKIRRSSLYLKDEQQNKLEYLVIQFNNLMYKIDIICNNSNFVDLQNQNLSCKYTQQIIYCFLTPHQSQKPSSFLSNNQNQASSSFNIQNKQKPSQIIRYPPSINTLFFIFYSYLNIQSKLETYQILQDLGNKQSKVQKFATITNTAYMMKSFFQIYNKAHSQQNETLAEIINQWDQLFNYCLNEGTDPIFSVVAIVVNKDIFSTYPELMKQHNLIHKFLEKSKQILGYLIDPVSAPEDFSYMLAILLAGQDFNAACHSSSFVISSLSSIFPSSGNQQSQILLQSYLLESTTIWNHSAINDEYSKQSRSIVIRSIIILLKNLYQVQEIKKMSFPLINQFITTLANHFISLFQPNINIETLFTIDVIFHLQSLFFTVLLDQLQNQEIKLLIWDFILKNINSQYNQSKQIQYHSIQFINSFALADQMSLIQKSTINRIMRTITQILQEKVQKDVLVSRQLLNCLQNWIFNFRYFEINCRKHFKDAKRFLENLIKALHNISQISDLQYDVQFFLSQLMKNYLDQRQDDMFSFQLEDLVDVQNDLLSLQSRESVYHTISCHESMKQQQKIIFEISKIEKDVLKQKTQQATSFDCGAQNQLNTSAIRKNQQNQGVVSQIKKYIKKNSNQQLQDISEYIPDFIENKYLSFCLDSEKLVSFLLDNKSQIYAIIRDLNGKFIWKVREKLVESPIQKALKSHDKLDDQINLNQQQNCSTQQINLNNHNPPPNELTQKQSKSEIKDKKHQPNNQNLTSYLQETHKSEGSLINMIKNLPISNEERRKVSKDIPKQTKNDQLSKIIEQIIYFIHEQIVQTENESVFDDDEKEREEENMPRSPQKSANFNKQFSIANKHDPVYQETVTRSLKSFIQEVPFMIKENNKCNFIDHQQDSYLNIINQIDQYSTSDKVKIGVLFMGKDQDNEQQILQAQCGSQRYERFLENLGEKVKLSEHQGFLGGLSPDRDGEYTIYNHFYNCEVVYHVVTMMPIKNKEDKQFVSKKRHIGNDFVNIIWCENIRKYQQYIIPSQLTTAYIVIHPLTNNYYRINLIRKDKLGDFFFPWIDKSVIHESFLDTLVKIVSLQASYCVQQYQARYHQNLPQNILRPYKSRQSLIFQIQEQLSIPQKSNIPISELFSIYQPQPFIGNTNQNQNQKNTNNLTQNQSQIKIASNTNISNNISNRLKI